MRDTPIDVEPETFDAASKVVGQDMAGQLTDAVAGLEEGLGTTAAMGGSDPGGMKWASAYDEAASVTAGVVTDLANACCKIAEMLEQTGFNHGAADDASDPRRTVPTGPDTTTYFPRPTVTPTPPPSARGGTGAPPNGWGLIQHAVGYVWPNGDTNKLRLAAQAWATAASTIDGANRSFPEAIEAIRSQQSPEVDDAATVCQTLSQHIEDTAASCRDLSTACTDYANQLDQAHQDVENELSNLLASTAVIEGAGVVATEVAGEFWAQGVEAGRVAATATRVGEILAPLAEMASAAADTVTTIVSRVAQVAQRLKVILGAQITRATAAVVERLPGLAEDTEAQAAKRLGDEASSLSPESLVDQRVSDLAPEVRQQVREAITRARDGKTRFPGRDGKPFRNFDKSTQQSPLPQKSAGYYREWTAASQQAGKSAPDRVIIGGDPENPDVVYYWDHANGYTVIYP